ncbi:hypothetical protein [Acinetobacter sp. 16]|uniref:hypothetical protein n=1 Tax=Acinetobacter sp. 16 TaxID=3081771 RepID=UPI002970045C|nr:hypothetical protein [Acinetobacter sp. 16]
MTNVTALPITGATASDSSALGTPSVSNVAQSSFVQGFRVDAVGVLSLGLSNAAIDLSFDFTEKYEKLTGQVRMRFSGPIVQPSITLGDCSGFGQLGIVNTAQVTDTVGGIKQEAYGFPAAFYADTAHTLNLNFVTPLEIITGDYVSFFTGARPIAPKSFESLAFGGAKIDSPIDAKPFGFAMSSFGIGVVINAGRGLPSINFENNTDKTDSISLRLDFGTGPRPIVPFGIDAPILGTESKLLNTADVLYLEGILSTSYGMVTISTSDSAHSFDLNFQRNLVEQNPLNVPFYFAERGSIKPYAIYSEKFGEHKIKNRDSVVSGVGGITLADAFGVPRLYGTQFIKHQGFNANLIQLHTVFNLTQIAYTTGITPGDIGTANIINRNRYITATGFSAAQYGTARLHNDTQIVRHVGALFTTFGNLNARNLNRPLPLQGFTDSFYGRPLVYNLRQYIRAVAFTPSLYGNAYLLGGVRYVNLSGLNASAISQPGVVNTRADRVLKPLSIGTVNLPNPNVSPRILYPFGILPGPFGMAWVQRNPSPKGFTTDSYGTAWVSHSPRYITPFKVDAFQSGYAKIFDPMQRIHHEGSPHIPGGIFGDIAIKNSRRVLSVPGEDHSRYGDWSELHSNLINVAAQPFDAKAFGSADIWNKTPSVIPQPFNSSIFGTAFISYRVRRILGRGIDMPESQRFGKHILAKPPELKPGSIFGQAFGNTWVSNKTRHINPHGLNTLQISSPVVWFRYRYVSATGINFPDMVAPKIEHGLRTLLAKGGSFNVFGTPTAWFRVRSIKVSSIFREFETNHLVGGTQHIRPGGFDAVRFGERIIPEIQGVYAQGFNSQCFSEINQIELHTRWVRAIGFLSFGQQASDRYGTAKVWNKRQYIKHSYDSGDGLNPGGFGQWNTIANRNREMKVSGFDAARFGYQQIDNNARPLLPLSFMPGVFGTAMIADRVRRIRLEGMEAPYMSGWGRVFNAAHLISALGGKHEVFSSPSVLNTRREYRWVGAFESMRFGQPMIAFRIRNIHIESRYSIAPIYLPLPKFDLHTRYIEPQGSETDAFGGPSLHIKWNIITTRWSHRELFGDPFVRNLTPELKQRGANSAEFGKPTIRLQWERYPVEGFGNEIFGRQLITFRDRSMTVSGFNAFASGRINVTKTGAPPYSLQTITLDWDGEDARPEDFEGQGIGVPRGQVSNPSLKTNVIFASGFVATAFGSHHAQSNGILVEPGIQQFAIGDHIVGLKDRNISITSIASQAVVGRPRLSPHTIYAVMESPEQARINHHTGASLHYVNSDNGRRTPGEVFGWSTVTLRHRKLTLGIGNQSSIGKPYLILRKHYLRPIGIQSFRMGWHFLSDGSPRELVQFDSIDNALYGRPTVTSPYFGPRYIRPGGFNAATFSNNWVEYFHRTVKINGFNALAMGAGRSGDTPYKPQGLWVGPQMPTIPKGFTSELFGTTWVSNKVRDISAVGFDSLENDWDISSFKERMQVILVKKPIIIEPKEIQSLAFSQTVYGVPNIRLKTHYIRPDGNSDQYRKGAPK